MTTWLLGALFGWLLGLFSTWGYTALERRTCPPADPKAPETFTLPAPPGRYENLMEEYRVLEAVAHTHAIEGRPALAESNRRKATQAFQDAQEVKPADLETCAEGALSLTP